MALSYNPSAQGWWGGYSNTSNVPSQGMGYPGAGSSDSGFDTSVGALPTYTAPTYTPPAPYVAPEWDESRVESLAQRKAAPGLRAARSQVQEIQGKYEENPNVKAMTLRQALAGYGLAVEQVMGGAETSAESEYGREYAVKAGESQINYGQAQTTAQMNYQASLASANANFQGAEMRYQDLFQNYMKQRYGGPSATPAGTPGAGTTGSGRGGGISWYPSEPSVDPWAPGGAFNPASSPSGGGLPQPTYSWPSGGGGYLPDPAGAND